MPVVNQLVCDWGGYNGWQRIQFWLQKPSRLPLTPMHPLFDMVLMVTGFPCHHQTLQWGSMDPVQQWLLYRYPFRRPSVIKGAYTSSPTWNERGLVCTSWFSICLSWFWVTWDGKMKSKWDRGFPVVVYCVCVCVGGGGGLFCTDLKRNRDKHASVMQYPLKSFLRHLSQFALLVQPIH